MTESCNPEPEQADEPPVVWVITALGGVFCLPTAGFASINVDARVNGHKYVYAVSVSYRLHGAIWRALVAATDDLTWARGLARLLAKAMATGTMHPDYDEEKEVSTAWYLAHHWREKDVSLRT